jgi:hypothetical protein
VEKICKRCGVSKKIQKFKTDKRRDDGRSACCRECYETKQLEVWKRTPEQIEAQRSKLQGRKYSLEHRLAISKGQKIAVKEGRHHWKRNDFENEDQDRCHIAYKIWKEKLLERCGGKCETCGKTERLHAHHIECFYKRPELRFEINNGKILCISCHMRLHRSKKMPS